ncbi:MAG: hypothetical protein ACK419_02200, partial [Pyrinomonadaceae bacterium]
VLFLTIQSSFISAVAMATITRLLVYATTCLSLLIFRYRNRVGNQNSETSKSTFKAPFGILVSVLSIVLIFYLLSNIKFEEIRNLFVFAIVGLVVYLANLVFRKI